MHDREDAAPQAAFAGKRVHARRAQFNEAELGRDEKAVERHQQQGADDREELNQGTSPEM